jgi:aminocarboxymuconate-semialdehyde decarboxylase
LPELPEEDSKSLRKIDIHTHILPKEIPAFKKIFGYGGFIELLHTSPCCAKMMKDDGQFFREIESNSWDPETRVSEFTAQGVSQQVLSTVPVMFSYWAKAKDTLEVARYLNDDIARQVQLKPDRFFGLATVPMQDPELAIIELRRAMLELGLQGVQIGTNINGENLGEKKYFDFFKECEKLGASVFIHPWEMMGEKQMQKYWLPWLVGMPAEVTRAICSLIFSGCLEALPKLRIAFAHGGGSFVQTRGRIEHGFHVRPDLVAQDNPFPPQKYLKTFYVDSLVHDPEILQLIVRVFGEDRVLLGSDYPYPLGEHRPGQLIEENFSGLIKDKLMYQNALHWLGK